MNCNCGAKLKEKRVPLYHYVESGLPNVFLADIKVGICPKCNERYPIIPSILELHEMIAEAIALKPVSLTGEEAKFLRKQLGLSAAHWATFLRLDKATVSRHENGHTPIGKQLDAFIRLLYFRLLEEKESRHIHQDIARKIATVNTASAEMGVSLPIDNPAAYRFEPTQALARAAAC
jgi:hypothetical protein